MIRLKNKHLNVHISPIGAEIKSIIYKDKERLWQGEEGSWKRTAPTLFPFCGGLKDGKFTYNGQEYECEKHGFAKDMEFTVTEKQKRRAVLEIRSSEETLKVYPFEFIFRVIFTINKKSLMVKYEVKNTGTNDMYFSVGSHEGYFCSGGIENFELLFPYRESVENTLIEQGLLGDKKQKLSHFSKHFPLYEKHLEADSLVIENLISRKCILRNLTNGERIKIEFPGSDCFVVWSLKGKEYICLEPWAGLPDTLIHTGEIEKKRGIIRLKKNKTKVIAHKITFLPEL